MKSVLFFTVSGMRINVLVLHSITVNFLTESSYCERVKIIAYYTMLINKIISP